MKLKYNCIEFVKPEPLDQYDPDYTKTLNEIKKTRAELIEEYKNMMHSSMSNNQTRFEPVNFGQNFPFLKTSQSLKKPRFDDTLKLLLVKNRSFTWLNDKN